ncbi:MAG: ATP-binding protein [Pseudomonadota bacterium]
MSRFCLLVILVLMACASPARAHDVGIDLNPQSQLYRDDGQGFPADAAAFPAWQAALAPAPKVDLLGGAYWMVARVRAGVPDARWVFDPHDTLIEKIEARVYGADGSLQSLHGGYLARHDYMLHYGMDLKLEPGHEYVLAVRFSSPYYARAPVMSLLPADPYRTLVARENTLIIGALGALLALALFNFFIFSFTRDRSPLYYSLYVLCYASAWAMTFQLPSDLYGWHHLAWHYVPFFLLPVFSTLFYLRFLRLDGVAPRLARASRINFVLPLLAMPSCFLALGWAHTLATIAISVWMLLALASGVVAWRQGYRPARYFVFAFLALMLPGLAILPANLGLIPALVDNAQLLTLLGGTLDGLLLAFALADQIRLLRSSLERRVDARTADLQRANAALTAARDHAEVVSRHRIDFLSAMSHDIRTPLAGVIGMLKFALGDQTVHGRTREYLHIGLQNGQSLLAILNDILDFSKIDAGKLTLETLPFQLGALVEEAVGILRGHADSKSLLLRCELAPGLPDYVSGDPTRIRQVLINLLGNAIKFTEHGEVLLAVTASEGQISFSVRDSGPGITPEVRARLFQKFEQADHSTTRRYGGTGLGLAICKQLVELMHGQIGVESSPGAGARFFFTLPLAVADAPGGPAAPRRRERHGHQLRILCAEDVRTNQIIIGTLLENMGHQVHIVENGVEALHALGAGDFDLVLMDGRMPLMDGEQAARKIRGGGDAQAPVREPGIAIIALTANASEPDCARYLAAGMNGFLSKPVDEQRLYDVIEETIARLLAAGRALHARHNEQALAIQFGVAAAGAPTAVSIVPLAGLSAAHMDKIRCAFIDEAPRRLVQARQAAADGDADAASAALHALKGSAGYLSSDQLHRLAHSMELLAAQGDLAQLEDRFPQIEALLGQTIADLRPAQTSSANFH